MKPLSRKEGRLALIFLPLLLTGCTQTLEPPGALAVGAWASYDLDGPNPGAVDLHFGVGTVRGSNGGEQGAILIHYWVNHTGDYADHVYTEWVDPATRTLLAYEVKGTVSSQGEEVPRTIVEYSVEGTSSFFGAFGTEQANLAASARLPTTILNPNVTWGGQALPDRIEGDGMTLTLRNVHLPAGESIWSRPTLQQEGTPDVQYATWDQRIPPAGETNRFTAQEAWEWAATHDPPFKAWLDKNPDAFLSGSILGIPDGTEFKNVKPPIKSEEQILAIAPGYWLHVRRHTYGGVPATHEIVESEEHEVGVSFQPHDLPERLVTFGSAMEWAEQELGDEVWFAGISSTLPTLWSTEDVVHLETYAYRIYFEPPGAGPVSVSIPYEFRISATDGRILQVHAPEGVW